MQKIFFILLILCLSAAKLLSQGSMQYNGVKLITVGQTVPVGKVWKVESVLSNQYDMQNINITGMKILVNGIAIYLIEQSGAATSSNAYAPTKLPLWLPEGTTLAPSVGVAYISLVEFNLIP